MGQIFFAGFALFNFKKTNSSDLQRDKGKIHTHYFQNI
jgi:hypothetical protein